MADTPRERAVEALRELGIYNGSLWHNGYPTEGEELAKILDTLLPILFEPSEGFDDKNAHGAAWATVKELLADVKDDHVLGAVVWAAVDASFAAQRKEFEDAD